MKFFAGIATAFEMPLAEIVVIWEQAEQRENQNLAEGLGYSSDTY
jgi:hypothetical protein